MTPAINGPRCMACSAEGEIDASLSYLAGFVEGLKTRAIRDPAEAAKRAKTKLCAECLAVMAGIVKSEQLGRMLTDDEFDRFIRGQGIDS